MANTKTTSKLIVGLALAMLALSTGAQGAQDHGVGPVAKTAGATSIPVGHLEFCRARPGECTPNTDLVPAVALDEARWGELLDINADMNRSIVPITDQDLYQVAEFWTYPNGYGDCEDIALAKRGALIRAGWPASTLLMAVVREANGDGHAVLMVRTDRGDLVLDNKDGRIHVWNETPYHFVKRQSQADAGQWVDLIDERAVIMAASR